MQTKFIATALVSCTVLAGCTGEGLKSYSGPNDYIAIASDTGDDATPVLGDKAAVAVTPDGCQAWFIDDGVEGRASNRLDPVSGLPVCKGEPGVVYGDYQSGTPGIVDRVPSRVPRMVQKTVQTRPTTGHYHQTSNGRYVHSHGHKGPHSH